MQLTKMCSLRSEREGLAGSMLPEAYISYIAAEVG
ncbi:hypothetical protein MLPF_1758 [Mycobacterium lepromatosis]|nr:hypothetical protein MLPF_1758 [Mycobacterium lepromatosis]